MFEPRILHGTGKRVTTLLTEDGCIYPIIGHDAKNDRLRMTSAPQHGSRILRGERPMHQTTLMLAKPPWIPDYTTTSQQFHGGSKVLEPEPRPQKARSMHHSQLNLGSLGDKGSQNILGQNAQTSEWKTRYEETFYPKQIIPANRLHWTSHVNRINQMEGAKTKEAVRPADDQPMTYFTQYKRTHDMLGLLRGPGVEREPPVRVQFNVITGADMGPAWKPFNERTSGNRVLHKIRSALPSQILQ